MNLGSAALIEKALIKKKGKLTSTGALVAYSGSKTGRSPKDKRIVLNDQSKDIWWGDINIPLSEELFELYTDYAVKYLSNRLSKIDIVDAYAGWDPKYRVGVRVYSTNPYHSLFMKNMLVGFRDKKEEFEFKPEVVIYNVGHIPLTKVKVRPDLRDESLSDTLVALKFGKERSTVLIYGTEYAGEMKKAILTYMMWKMPIYDHLTLHSSANVSKNNLSNVTFFFGMSGTGKCLGKDTPVLMYDGTIKMVQDITVGEQIMGDDSKPRNILSVCSGKEKLYEITNKNNNVRYIVNESHILSLKAHPNELNEFKTEGDIVDISLQDYLTKIPELYKCEGNELLCGYRVPVDFPSKEVDVDPYIVGYWLGNGKNSKQDIECKDQEMLINDNNNKEKVFNIISPDKNCCQKDCNIILINAFRKYGLFRNKHIPIEYKCNSRAKRLSLLAGIIDARGYYDKERKGLEVTLKCKRLTDDLIYLCRSLGYYSSKTNFREIRDNKEGGHKTQIYYRTSIAGHNLSEIPCLLQCKKAQPQTQIKSSLKYTIKVKELDIGEYYGFEIDGNKRFLLGDFSVTHNTSLSTDERFLLVGDDEHVWTEEGIFNIEGGCYAKCIGLKREKEPEIFQAIRFGAVLENVVMDDSRIVDYDNTSITPNTRVSYPLNHIENVVIPAVAPHPKQIIFLVCDAFGLLPPVALLTPEQAVFFFVTGYTSKIPGTEMSVTQPIPTFSACFGEPFLVWHPKRYGELLKQKIETYKCPVYLLNTGWTEGGYGKGKRIPIEYSRAMVKAISEGGFENYEDFPVFNFKIPKACSGVPSNLLNPLINCEDKNAYIKDLTELHKQFQKKLYK